MMEKNLTAEKIEMINRIVFEHVDKMNEKIADIVGETEAAAHQQLQ